MVVMTKSFGLLIALLLFVVGCACPSAAPTSTPTPTPTLIPTPTPTPTPEPSPAVSSEYAEGLAERFCPIIYLKGEGGTTENFEPEQIEIMVDEAFLRDVDDPAFSEKATLPSLLQWSKSAYYLDLAGLGPTTHSLTEYKLTYDEVKDRYQPTLYARVKEGGSKGYTVVQYWIFYYFNDWRNFHEGDWEVVQLCFPAYTARELLEREEQPVFAAYSQHQAGQKMSWSAMNEKGLVEGTHPIVYVAQGSHANYFTPGNSWSGLDFDDTGLSSWRVISPEQLSVVLLPEIEASDVELEWLGFKGYWGEYLGFSISVLGLNFWQHGPLGPEWSKDEQKSQRWEYPGEWAAGLAEYPEPFWTSFLELPGDWSKLAIFSLFSPAELHVYDSLGRHVGVNEEGELEKQIAGAIYITPEGTDYKTILIPDADVGNEYSLLAKGTGSGTMDIRAQVPDAVSKLKRFLEYIGVPISTTTIARANIKPELPELVRALSPAEMLGGTVRDTTTKLEVDSDGDGTFDLESTSGSFEEMKTLLLPITAEIDMEPDTLDIASVTGDELITAFVELPRDYDPKSIDVSTVRLMGDIPAWQRLLDIVDHDQDGTYELMVKFDLQPVIEYLEGKGQVDGKVSFTLTGTVDGRPFDGEDIVLVIMGKEK